MPFFSSSIVAGLATRNSASPEVLPKDSAAVDAGSSSSKMTFKNPFPKFITALAASASVPPVAQSSDGTAGPSSDRGRSSPKTTFKNPFPKLVAALAARTSAPPVAPANNPVPDSPGDGGSNPKKSLKNRLPNLVATLSARISAPPVAPSHDTTPDSSGDGSSSPKKSLKNHLPNFVAALSARISAPPVVDPAPDSSGGGSLSSKKLFKNPFPSLVSAFAASTSSPPVGPEPSNEATVESSNGARSNTKETFKNPFPNLIGMLAAGFSVPSLASGPPNGATAESSNGDSPRKKKIFKNPFPNAVAALAASTSAPPATLANDATIASSSNADSPSPKKSPKVTSISTIVAALAATASVPVVPPLQNQDPSTSGSFQDCSSLDPKKSSSKKILSDAWALFIDNRLLCVVCKVRRARDDQSVTCSLACTEKFCEDGPTDATVCDVCYRLPREEGERQCGQACADTAKIACLLCRSRPKNGRHDFCGLTCRAISLRLAPLILDIPKGHATYDMVERHFKASWKAGSSPIPEVTRIYKVVESEEFHRPYDLYRERIGPEECYRYHGTSRQCDLGVSTKRLCASSTCPVCNILKSSFKVDLAKPSGAFGKGVYTSSASNKAFSYCKVNGALLLNKAVLGRVKQVHGWSEVMSCPPEHDSVVFDRLNGSLNETIFYSDDAIRPVFLIIFQ